MTLFYIQLVLILLLKGAFPYRLFRFRPYVRSCRSYISIDKELERVYDSRKLSSLYARDSDYDEVISTRDSEDPESYESAEDLDEDVDEDEISTDDYDIDGDSLSDSISTLTSDEPQFLTWKQRIEFARLERKTTYDVDEDPLKAASPTVDVFKPVDRFKKHFLAISSIPTDDMLKRRGNIWLHHMQWVRRSALLPHSTALVDWEYTRLSHDCSRPVGQVLGLRANTSIEARELLESEPLSVIGGVTPWTLFELQPEEHENTTWDKRTQQMFIGMDKTDLNISPEDIRRLRYQQLDYHQAAEERTTYFAHILPVADEREACAEDAAEKAVGTLLLINARTNTDALRHMASDPVVTAGLYEETSLNPVNMQDIDGKHHVMARTFGQKAQLDQVHFMEPEDLLLQELEPMEQLPHHSAANKHVVDTLASMNISYKYTRLTLEGRHGRGGYADEEVADFNAEVAEFQKIRLEPIFEEATQQEIEDEAPAEEYDAEDDDDDDDDWNDNQQKSIVGRCLVQYDYKGARDDELNLKNGDIIEIIEKRTDGWWRGLLNNSIGLFPSTYVKEI